MHTGQTRAAAIWLQPKPAMSTQVTAALPYEITAQIECGALTSSTTLSCAAPNPTTAAAIAHSRIITPHGSVRAVRVYTVRQDMADRRTHRTQSAGRGDRIHTAVLALACARARGAAVTG